MGDGGDGGLGGCLEGGLERERYVFYESLYCSMMQGEKMYINYSYHLHSTTHATLFFVFG